MLTPNDIRNDKTLSGYSHVAQAWPPGPNGGGGQVKWFARRRVPPGTPLSGGVTRNGNSGNVWHGPRRATALEAAQDYCDYANGAASTTPALAALKSAGHKRPQQRRQPDPPEVSAARRVVREHDAARRAGSKGYVYLVAETPKPPFGAVKIGWSMSPATRVAGLQTGNPRKLYVLASKTGTEADEAALHAKYIKQNVLQEWFRPTAQLLSEFGLSPDQKEASAT